MLSDIEVPDGLQQAKKPDILLLAIHAMSEERGGPVLAIDVRGFLRDVGLLGINNAGAVYARVQRENARIVSTPDPKHARRQLWKLTDEEYQAIKRHAARDEMVDLYRRYQAEEKDDE